MIRTSPPSAAPLRGRALLESPRLNRDTAFGEAERDALGLRGLLPPGVTRIEQQVALELEHVRQKREELEKYIGLMGLLDRNETLFHRVLLENLEELAPIVYTPTVGRACRQYSHVMRRPRGLWITPDDVERIPELLQNAGRDDVRLIVVTDNERILGLGDQGAGGMGIPIGKLALYTAGAGIRPSQTLPVSLDVGTDNASLLQDPLYLGYRERRLRGEAYDAFVEAFVEAVQREHPRALLQWEDFKQHNAIRLLDRYRHRLPSFNDDIQGTAAVVLAGILAALRHRRQGIGDQRVLFLGAGAAGIGIARLLRAAAGPGGVELAMLDSHGLVRTGRADLDADKLPFALSPTDLAVSDEGSLEAVVRAFRPTILIGTCGRPGAFTEEAIRALAEVADYPLVLPLSNPTSQSEATPADVLAWTGGRALVATGSPFEPVTAEGRLRVIGQANNMFVFPGIGLGAIAAEAREVSDGMFLMAARALADQVSDERLAAGAIYPAIAGLRQASRAVGEAVAREARDAGVGRMLSDAAIREAVDATMWWPDYS